MNIVASIDRQTPEVAASGLHGIWASGTEDQPFRPQPNFLSQKSSQIAQPGEISFVFGPYRLLPARRLLLQGDRTIPLGSRAFDILVALVESRGELVTKQELMKRVWPDTTVVEANLSVHIAALRRAFGDGRDSNRYLLNIPGRGYRFIAPVAQEAGALIATPQDPDPKREMHQPAAQLIGDRHIDESNNQMAHSRFLASTGPSGGGKTAAALAVAEQPARDFPQGVCSFDLASIADPDFLRSAVATALQVDIPSSSALSSLLAAVRDKSILLVLLTATPSIP